jgi:hypothetical protein
MSNIYRLSNTTDLDSFVRARAFCNYFCFVKLRVLSFIQEIKFAVFENIFRIKVRTSKYIAGRKFRKMCKEVQNACHLLQLAA